MVNAQMHDRIGRRLFNLGIIYNIICQLRNLTIGISTIRNVYESSEYGGYQVARRL